MGVESMNSLIKMSDQIDRALGYHWEPLPEPQYKDEGCKSKNY